MSKRKLTVDDKKSALLDFFHEAGETFQLKELEKMAPRSTGIAQQAIKDILQKLLDDGLVDSCKIGSSIFYWSFPGKAKTDKLVQLEALQNELATLNKQVEECNNELREKAKADEDPVAIGLESKIEELKGQHQTLKDELGDYDENDLPEVWEKMEGDLKNLHEAANRWTDNVFTIKSWCKKKFNCEDSMLDKQFRIPSDFDYIE